MKVPGADVFRELRGSLDEIHGDAARVRDEHQRLDSRMNDLITERGAALLELARHYLPTISRDAVESSFAEIRDDLRAILERKDRRSTELTGRLERLRGAADAAQLKQQGSAAAANEAAVARDAAQAELAKRLTENVEFQDLSKRALAAEAELARDEERVEQIKREAKEKLPAYDRSTLFRYLYERRFGTPDYTGRGLARRLDRWVARLIDYGRAGRSYNFLQVTPQLMEAETARRREEFHRTMDRIEAIEKRAAEDVGLAARIRQATEAAADQERLTGLLAGDRERVQSAEQELSNLDQQQGQFYEEALSRFRTFLAKTETGVLESRARETAERIDDEIVTRIRILTDEINELEPRVRQLLQDGQAATKRSEGMDFIVRRFEQGNFHESRSFFEEGFDVRPLIQQYRAGAFDKDAFWTMLKRAQERIPTELEQRAAKAATDLMNSPMTGALVEAMVTVAGAALSQSVGRSVDRRRNFHSGGTSSPIDAKPNWVRTNPK